METVEIKAANEAALPAIASSVAAIAPIPYPVGFYQVHINRTAYAANDSLVVEVVEPDAPLTGLSMAYGDALEDWALKMAKHLYFRDHESQYEVMAIVPTEPIDRESWE